MSDGDSSFLSRWSRRKATVREGKAVPEDEALAPAAPPQSLATLPPQEVAPPPPPAAAPLPTLADVAVLRPGDNIARFVAQGVDESVKRAALKTLFADPHFNVMDGLDTYIDDYSKPDPIPLEVLRKLRQSETLGLFDPVEPAEQAGEAGEVGEAGEEAAARQSLDPEPESGQAHQATTGEEPAPAPEQPERPAEDKHA